MPTIFSKCVTKYNLKSKVYIFWTFNHISADGKASKWTFEFRYLKYFILGLCRAKATNKGEILKQEIPTKVQKCELFSASNHASSEQRLENMVRFHHPARVSEFSLGGDKSSGTNQYSLIRVKVFATSTNYKLLRNTHSQDKTLFA